MKRITIPYSISTAPTIRRYAASACAALLLAACTSDDALSGADSEHHSNTPVTFTTRVQAALPQATPATRTTIGADGQTGWVEGDAVGVFMVHTYGGIDQEGLLLGADNIKYTVTPSTGALTPVATPIYYHQNTIVDFIAYYPYSPKGTGVGEITDEYEYPISLTDQSQPEKIDVMHAKATGLGKSKNPVELNFAHVLSKIKFNIVPGKGVTGLTADKITDVTITGMHSSGKIILNNGKISTIPPMENIVARKEVTPSPDATAAFTALVFPDTNAGSGTRNIIVTVDGEQYTGTIPEADAYASNEMYTYPVTVQNSEIFVGKPEIGRWDSTDHGSSMATIVINGVDVMHIPAGEFEMGSPDGESGRNDDETQHKVILTQDFYMSKYEITTQQYAEFLNAIKIAGAAIGEAVSHEVEGYDKQALFKVNAWGWTPKWNETTHQWEGEERKPMLYVSWYGAKAYADWIGGALPTEAQWEYACRAGTETAYWFGNDAAYLGNYEWYYDNTTDSPNFVGEKLPNPWGLYDMHGNVREWCADWYGKDYYASSPERDPIGPALGEYRVNRGGYYATGSKSCRSAYRCADGPDTISDDIGFRIIFLP